MALLSAKPCVTAPLTHPEAACSPGTCTKGPHGQQGCHTGGETEALPVRAPAASFRSPLRGAQQMVLSVEGGTGQGEREEPRE